MLTKIIMALAFLLPVSFCQAQLKYIDINYSDPFSDAVVINGEPLIQTGQIFPDLEPGVKSNDPFDSLISKVEKVLKDSGSSLNDIVKLNFYVTDDSVAEIIRKQWKLKYPSIKPAVSFVTTPLPVKFASMSVDVLAKTSNQVDQSQAVRKIIKSSNGQPSLSSASYASERMVYISGQAENGTLAEATTKTLQSLHDSLKWMKLDASHVVQIKLFMKPMSDSSIVYKMVNDFYKKLGVKKLPAVSLVEWTNGLPIEIEMVAVYPENDQFLSMASAQFLTVPGMKASSVYCRVAVTNSKKLAYLSGLYSKKELAGQGETELRNLYSRLEQVLKQVNSSFDFMIKATYYVSDPATSSAFTPVRMELYNFMRPPAASKASVKAVGNSGFTTTIDMIAISKD